ncbi:MAG: alpha-E domain-containing protein [Agitococcus sp.]|nr:alpha-E domain-containing protein [Agitococcus sp.]
MLLLSTAADLYWLGRYLSRAQSLVSVLLNAFNEATRDNLTIPLSMTATGSYYYHQYSELKESSVAAFFLDGQNPSSVSACVASLRADAQATRGRLSQDLWLSINTLYLDWQVAFLTQKDFADSFKRYQTLQIQLQELMTKVEFEPDNQVQLFINIGIGVEVLDGLLRYSLIKSNGEIDTTLALTAIKGLSSNVAMLPHSIWGNVSDCVDRLQHFTTQTQSQAMLLSQMAQTQSSTMLLQQHLQDLTKALSDVFAH